jgi:hypothetical protein
LPNRRGGSIPTGDLGQKYAGLDRFAAVSIVVCFELYKYGLAYLGVEPAGILKLTIFLPFVWLLLESKKKLEVGK